MIALLLWTALAHAGTLRATLHVAEDGRLSIVHATEVEGEVFTEPGQIEIVDAKGAVITSAELPPLQSHRGVITPEGHDGAPVPSRYVRVELPWPDDAVGLRVAGEPLQVRLSLTPPAPLPAGLTLERVYGEGPPSRRLDLLIVPDGYTADRRAAFDAHADAVAEQLLSIEPYRAYASMFNVWKVFIPSTEPSADPSRDGGALGPNDTPFQCAYGCTDIFRLVCCDEEALVDAVDQLAPFADGLLVLMDSSTFGGSGGLNYAVTFTGAGGDLVSSHELGHTLVYLWDEYPYGYEADTDNYIAPNCSPADQPIPWYHWMDEEHPEIGAFQTCSFSDWVRPTANNCLMNSLQPGYCAVCREHIVKTIYRKINARMVGTTEPEVGTKVRIREGEQVTFTADAVEPVHGLSWQWSFAGVPLSNERTVTIDGCDGREGELELVLRDETPWVRNDPKLFLVDRLTWDVKTDPCDGSCSCTQPARPSPVWALWLVPLWWRWRGGRA
jgi:hypothetical protein